MVKDLECRRGYDPIPARIVETEEGREVRCPQHGHLLGVYDLNGRLIIKCRGGELVIVEDVKA